MKKVLAFLSIGIIWCFLPMIVHAETTNLDPAVIAEKLNSYFNDELTYNSAFTSYINGNFSYNSNLVFVYYPAGHSITLYKKADSNPILYDDRIIFPDCFYIANNGGSGYSYSSNTFYFNDSNVLFFNNGEEMYDFFHVSINFDEIYYNPQIPVPKLNIWYLYQAESFREDGVANFTANIDVPDSTEFYIQLAWKYSYPQNIRVYSSDMKGTPAYDYELYQSSDLIPIYSLQDMQQAINLHITGSDLQTEWQAAYDDFIDGVTFYTNQNNAPANWLSTARLNYVNKMATQIPLYGNRLEVFARYWTLSEDNQVVVGKWYHWQSAKGSATEDVPETYVNYQELPGYAGTVEYVPTDDENTYTGTGENTGDQATTIINYAPNYPDYPTAVSYNHDNILLQMIQTSKQLPQFFGQFTNFLSITLAFIDPGVWAIIGFGFTCCIVIMIIKVL